MRLGNRTCLVFTEPGQVTVTVYEISFLKFDWLCHDLDCISENLELQLQSEAPPTQDHNSSEEVTDC